jgi:DNA topoisomerase-1
MSCNDPEMARAARRERVRAERGERSRMATASASTLDPAARPEPRRSARSAGLRYASDTAAGIRRIRHGTGFGYRYATGRPVHDKRTLRRIRALVIPPAWDDVWICPDPRGHLQATGRDGKGRKVYRYHARFRAARDRSKFDRLLAFARVIPKVRRRVDRDLRSRELTREKVLAAVVRLLELSLIRVGNDEYARLNRSFGLTTLRDRHVKVDGTAVRFRFRGKSGQDHEVDIRDRRLATVIRRCQELPGQVLFQYPDGDQVREVKSEDVNDYLREAAGADVTTKDFRLWAGTVTAFRVLQELEPPESPTAAHRNVVAAVKQVAGRLGNTPAVARSSYVHPGVLEAYEQGAIRPSGGSNAGAVVDLPDERAEAAVVRLLRGPLERDARR